MAARADDETIRLSWIVVSHQNEHDLRRLLPTLLHGLDRVRARGLPAELLVVDNASTDGSRAAVAALAPAARLLCNRENAGYGAALNQAAGEARGEWLALSNADLHVPEGGLDRLPEALERAADDVALIGPEIRGEDGLVQLSAGVFPDLRRLLRGLFQSCGERKYLRREDHRAGPVDWATGACLFARRDALLARGGFDEDFFLYYEDVDLARRLRADGLRTLYEPAVSVVHHRPHHGRALSPDIQEIVRASRMRYFAKHRPRWERGALALLARVEPFVRREPGPPRTNGSVAPRRVVAGEVGPRLRVPSGTRR